MQREYPLQPRVGVGVVVLNKSKVLLVKRGQEPSKGLWSVPGGLVELGETLVDAAKREVKEETGIRIRIERLLNVADNVVRDDRGRIRFHYVLIDFLGRPITTRARSQSDISEVKWVRFNDLSKYAMTKGAKKILQKVEAVKRDRI